MFLLLRLLLSLLGLALVAVPAGLIAFALWIPQDQPLVARPADPTPEAVGRAHALLKRNDPRRLPPGAEGRLQLTQSEVDLALAALPSPVRARIELRAATAAIESSVALPALSGRYLNLRMDVVSTDAGLRPERLHIGPVGVPDWLTVWIARRVWQYLLEDPEWSPLAQAIRDVRMDGGMVKVAYRIPARLPGQLRELALPTREAAALRAQHRKLAQTLAEGRGPLPLPRLLAPLFTLAEERGGGADEYRAVLLAVGFPLAGRSLAAVAPEARTWPALPRRTVTLAGRVDSAQHFIVSALIAAHAGTPVANAAGLWKELEDSRGGSGFSFADLAADLAGTRAGEVLVGPGGSRLARQLAQGMMEENIVPRLADLPEGLDQATFRSRYGSPDDARYEALKQEIERRVAALPLGPGSP